uniref:Secreted protein n=1 Tax=Ixodes ricinus TaxID=34613 RepID=A0A6B0U0U4_IXORI
MLVLMVLGIFPPGCMAKALPPRCCPDTCGSGDWLLGEPREGRRPFPTLSAAIRALVSCREDVCAMLPR